jgi:hypothetical protein
MRRFARVLMMVVITGLATDVGAAYEDRPAWQRAGYTVLAGIENIVPIASAFAAPRCLPGYIVCKLSFAGISIVAAGEQLLFSGGSDLGQTRAILHRGFGGDWILTGRHAAGDETPEVTPDPAPASTPEPPAS